MSNDPLDFEVHKHHIQILTSHETELILFTA